MKKCEMVYVDKLSFFSVLAAVRAGFGRRKIYYFDRTRTGIALALALARLRVLRSRPEAFDFKISEVRDANGECSFFGITEDISRICTVLILDDLRKRPLVKGLGRYFPLKDMLHFFMKIIEQEIREKVIHIHAAGWNERRNDQEGAVFLIENGLWSGHIEKYMTLSAGLEFSRYWSLNYMNWAHYLPRVWNKLKLRRISTAKIDNPDTKVNGSKPENRPRIAHWYTGKTITFRPDLRSDFFWFINSGMENEDFLLCFEIKGPNSAAKEALFENGLAFTESLARRAKGERRITASVVRKAFRNWVENSLRFDHFALFYFFTMALFARHYSRCYRFFSDWNIKVSVNQNDLGWQHVPMKLALSDCGGVAVSYQWSNLRAASLSMSGCADVMFSFGHSYDFFWKKTEAPLGWLIRCGYISDHCFDLVKGASRNLREALESNGARFILCFFDENSSDDRYSLITDRTSVEVHRYLLERVMEDSTLGLILKPGYPNTFQARMSEIRELIEAARTTGRCVIIDKGQCLKTDKYPAEAAQAADLAVGLLLSGTTALESHLSGVKTVFLDIENLRSDPVYGWGEGKAVFGSLDELFSAINEYRSDSGTEGFGDISRWAAGKDSFMDGCASTRIGRYVGWLFEKLKDGSGKESAISFANSRYAEIWGGKSVSKWH